MLSFVDQTMNIKVFRVISNEDGTVTRERLGVVRKRDFALDEQLEELSQADKSNIAEMIAFYQHGAKHEVVAALHALPSTLRKVIDHVLTEGTAFERGMVTTALVEALRIMRKADRNEEE